MKVIHKGDIVYGRGDGNFEGAKIPTAMESFPNERLRVSGGVVVDAAEFSTFFIDANGEKHILEAPDRQVLACAWNDELIKDGDAWRVKKTDEALSEAKTKHKGYLKSRVARFVERRYPQDVQLLFLNVLATEVSIPKMDRAREALNWIKSVYAGYAAIEGKINAKKKAEHVIGTGMDFAPFEKTDPNVKVSEVV